MNVWHLPNDHEFWLLAQGLGLVFTFYIWSCVIILLLLLLLSWSLTPPPLPELIAEDMSFFGISLGWFIIHYCLALFTLTPARGYLYQSMNLGLSFFIFANSTCAKAWNIVYRSRRVLGRTWRFSKEAWTEEELHPIAPAQQQCVCHDCCKLTCFLPSTHVKLTAAQ